MGTRVNYTRRGNNKSSPPKEPVVKVDNERWRNWEAPPPMTKFGDTKKEETSEKSKEELITFNKNMDKIFTHVTTLLWNMLVDINNMNDFQRKALFGTPSVEKVARLDLSDILKGIAEYQEMQVNEIIDEVKELEDMLKGLGVKEQDEAISRLETLIGLADKTKANVLLRNGKIL